MINIGGGWYGSDNRYTSIANYEMNEQSIELLKKIEKSSGCLSCRDWYTVSMLKEKGFKCEMHGCPAWYDTDYISVQSIRKIDCIKKICVSDPANINDINAVGDVLRVIKSRYEGADITFVFHRDGFEESGRRGARRRTILQPLFDELKIKWIDISGGHEGFAIYDDCDLHVGFRVHAHIYNLSRRNRTILLEEDGRGAGVNEALGFSYIHAYDDARQYHPYLIRRIENRAFPSFNSYIANQLLHSIERNEYTDWMEYNLAFQRMAFYFEHMHKHIEKMKNW